MVTNLYLKLSLDLYSFYYDTTHHHLEMRILNQAYFVFLLNTYYPNYHQFFQN
jgi:hypothetical protein